MYLQMRAHTHARTHTHTHTTFRQCTVAQEEVITAPGWTRLTAIWPHQLVEVATDLINFIKNGKDPLLEELVSILLLAEVEPTLQV